MIHPVMELEIFRFRERERESGWWSPVCVVPSQLSPGLQASLWLLMARWTRAPPHGSSALTAADMREMELIRVTVAGWQGLRATNASC